MKCKLFAAAVLTGCMMLLSAHTGMIETKADETSAEVTDFEGVLSKDMEDKEKWIETAIRCELKEVRKDGVIYGHGAYPDEDGEAESGRIFYYVKGFYQEYDKNGKPIHTKIEIKNTIDAYPVTEIGEGAFENCKDIVSVKIGNNVKVIHENAFAGCKKLNNVTFGSGKLRRLKRNSDVLLIDNSAFKNTKIYNKAKKKGTMVVTKQKVLLSDIGIDKNATFTGKQVQYIPGGLFENNKTIQKLQIDNIKYLGAHAFMNSSVKNVTINQITAIGEEAFYGCDMNQVQVLNADRLDEGVFSECNIQKIQMKNIKTIGYWMFECSEIESVQIENVKTIGCYILNGATVDKVSIKEVEIILGQALTEAIVNEMSLSDIKGIYERAFALSAIEKLKVENVDYMGGYLFDFGAVKEAELSEIERIDNYLLSMLQLGKMTLNQVNVMEEKTLESGLGGSGMDFTEVTINKVSDTMTTIENTGKAQWKEMIVDGVVYELWFYRDDWGAIQSEYQVKGFVQKYHADNSPVYTDVVIQNKVNGYKVRKVSKEAFKNQSDIKTVKFNNAMQWIEEEAFADCSALSDVTFAKLEKLKDLTIANNAFNNTAIYCNAVAKKQPVVTSQKVLLSNVGFGKKTTITGDKVKVIPGGLFENNKTIKTLTVKNVDYIGKGAFAYSKVKKVIINNVKCVGEKAFTGCNIKTLKVNNVEDIMYKAFAQCKLEKTTVHNVDDIGWMTFSQSNLKTISIKKVTNLRNLVFDNAKVKKATITNVKRINLNAFRWAYVKQLVMNKITSIGSHALEFEALGTARLSGIKKVKQIDNAIDTTKVSVDKSKEKVIVIKGRGNGKWSDTSAWNKPYEVQ